MNRRDFITGGLALPFFSSLKSIAGPAAGKGRGASKYQSKDMGRVVMFADSSLAKPDRHGEINRKKLQDVLEKMVLSYSGAANIKDGWRSFFSPGERIGIKVNCLGGRPIATHYELVEALTQSLQNAGFPANTLLIWERTDRELKRAGYKTNRRGSNVLCYGTDALPGGGYLWKVENSGRVGSCFSSILADKIDKLINIPRLKDHDLAGISMSMKNCYGVIHNPNKYHFNNCNPYVADLMKHPYLREKTALIICDGLFPQFHGGPANNDRYKWRMGSLLLGRDPVATDSMGWRIIEKKRNQKGKPTLKEEKRYPAWLETAARYGLGKFKSKEIDVIRI